MQPGTTRRLTWFACVRRDKRNRSQAVLVSAENLELIRTLYKQPEAEVGQYLVKYGYRDCDVKLMTEEHFRKYYREPR